MALMLLANQGFKGSDEINLYSLSGKLISANFEFDIHNLYE